jgi:membrane protease YdiL (CAAX protease family)
MTLINITIVVEALLLLVATGWSYFTQIPLLKPLTFSYQALIIGIGVGCVMAMSGFALYGLSRKFSIFGQLRDLIDNYLLPMVADLKPADLVIIALLSGFCEEIFFRGVAQPVFGIVLTSLAFGLFHDPSFRYISYAIIAAFYGYLLGLLYAYTGNLWAPIAAHVTHNLISLYILRYRIKPPAAPVESVK